MPSPSSATSITTDRPSRRAVTVDRASGGRVADRVRDEVVERLAQPVRVAVHGEPVLGLGDHEGATECRGLGGVTASRPASSRSSRREPARRVGEESLEPRHRRIGELQQAPPRRVVGSGYASAIATSAATGLRTSCASTASRLGAHRTLSPICAPAQAAASASIGSSLAAHSSTSGSASPAAGVAERVEGVAPQPAGIVPRNVEPVELRDELGPVARQPVEERDVRHRVLGSGRSRRRFSTPRFQGQTSWQMSQPYTDAPSSSRYASGTGAGACVQYERQRFASSTPGSSSAPVGQASMQSGQRPQSRSSGGVASISTSVTSVPSTTQEPCSRVISIVFLP